MASPKKKGPLKASEVAAAQGDRIPEFVFEAFNETILKHWDGYSASFTQTEVIGAILGKDPNDDLTREKVFVKRYLDVEDSFRKAGWKVEYDRPGFNETYPATFTFTKKRR